MSSCVPQTHSFFFDYIESILITTTKQIATVDVQPQGGIVVTAPAKGELK